MMSEMNYKCPKCKSPLVYHHEDKETVTFECKKCKHFVLAMRIKELEIENEAQSDAIDGLQGLMAHLDLEEMME